MGPLCYLGVYQVLSCIGEQMSSNPDEVCGVIIQCRPKKEDRLVVWTRSVNTNEPALSQVGYVRKIKAV